MGTTTLDQPLLATPEKVTRTSAAQVQLLALFVSALGFIYYAYQSMHAWVKYLDAKESMANNPFRGVGEGLMQMRLESVMSSAIVFGVLCVVLWAMRSR